MPEFHIDHKIAYGFGVLHAGDVVDLTRADMANLAAGGSGHGADDCSGACMAVKLGKASPSAKESPDAPPLSLAPKPGEVVQAPPLGTGPDDPPPPPADPEPTSFSCPDERCRDRKPFATAAALKAHRTQKQH